MGKKRLAGILKAAAIVLGVYAVGAWTTEWLMDGDAKWGVLDRSGKLIVPHTYDEMGEPRNGLVPVKLGEKWGLIDAAGKTVLEPQYGQIDWSGTGWIVRGHQAGSLLNMPAGWADASGKVVVAAEYQAVRSGGAAVKKNDRWTLHDERGAVLATGSFDALSDFSHGLAAAGRPKNLGVIDRKGTWLIQPRFITVIICGANCVLGRTSKDWRFYDRNGRELPGPAYSGMTELGHGFFRATTATKRPIVLRVDGGRAVEMPFQEMRGFFDGRAAFKADGKWGYLDTRGKVVVQPAYENARSAHDGVAAVQAGKTWHLIDANGGRIGAQEYPHVEEFSRGLARVQAAAGEVLVDKSGRVVFSLGESWVRLRDPEGKPLGDFLMYPVSAKGRYQPVVLSANAIGVSNYPSHTRIAASVFSFGSDSLTGSLETLGNVAAVLAVFCAIGMLLLGPAPAGRFGRGIASVAAAASGPSARAFARKAVKGFAYLVIGVAGLAVLVVLINLFDEDLKPEVAAYLKQQEPKPPVEARNGYFHFVGFAAKGDTRAAGMKYVAELNETQAKRLKGERVEWPKEPERLSFSDPRMCPMDTASCLSTVAENEREARRVVAESAVLLERYRALLDYPEYGETQQLKMVDTPLVSFGPLNYGQRAFFVALALKLRDGQVDAALADLDKNIAFNRRMLAGSQSLIGRMIAAAHLQRSASLASEILTAHRADLGARAARVGDALRPLSAQERPLGETLRAEFGLFAPLSTGAACKQGQLAFVGLEDPGVFASLPCLFLQPNATMNRMYFTSHKAYAEIDAAPPEKFDQAVKDLRPAQASFPDATALYNPVGKLIVAIGGPDWSDYIASMHDRDAHIRLVSLQALIVARKVRNADVPTFVAQAGNRYHDPYTGAPMRWDAARGQLSFEPRSNRVKRIATQGRLAVTL